MFFLITAQLQETRDTRKVELYYEKDTLLKLSNKDNQEASGMYFLKPVRDRL